jgi:hypothetical protein
MITADVSTRLLEVDFSGIEAVMTGMYLWRHGFSSEGAKQYIRLARLGMHAAVTSLKVGKPVDLTQDDTIVKQQLNAIKKAFPQEYDTSKRTVHANNFGMTTYGMVEKFPEFFPNLRAASEFQNYYYALAPDLPKWHLALRKRAKEAGFLGGPTLPGAVPSIWDHPYGYRHWFWDVYSYQPCNEFTARKWLKDPLRAGRIVYMHGRPFKIDFGGDGNRVIALYPQSTAAGRLKEAEMRLFTPWSDDYIGDCYFGRTPLLGPIHDSLLLHIPNRCFDRVAETVIRVMQEPSRLLPIPIDWGWGECLPIGVSAKAGRDWAAMEEIDVPTWMPAVPVVLSAGEDPPVLPPEGTGDEEDWHMLERSVA